METSISALIFLRVKDTFSALVFLEDKGKWRNGKTKNKIRTNKGRNNKEKTWKPHKWTQFDQIKKGEMWAFAVMFMPKIRVYKTQTCGSPYFCIWQGKA